MLKNKILKTLYKLILSLSILLVVLFFAVVGYVYQKEDEIYQFALAELNTMQVGRTEIDAIELKPFANFPYISIDLKGVRFYANDTIQETIYDFKDVYVGFDFWQIIAGNIVVKSIELKDGALKLEKNENGELNLLLAKEMKEKQQEIEDSSKIHLNLKKISLINVKVSEKIDYQEHKNWSVDIKKCKLKVSYIEDIIDFKIEGDFFLNEFTQEGISILKNKNIYLKSTIHYDLIKEFLDIEQSILELENNKLVWNGSLNIADSMNINMEFHGKKENFDLIFSFAPPEILEKLNQFKNEGEVFFDGEIKGKLEIGNPSINFNFGCKNTVFFHHGNQKALKDFSFNGNFNSGKDNKIESYEFSITNMYGVPESGQLKGTFKVVNFVQPQFSVDFHSDLDLAIVSKFYDIPNLEYCKGKVLVDITLNEFVDKDSLYHVASKLQSGTNSRILFKNISFKFKDLPHEFKNINGKIELDGDDIELKKLSVNIGKSDINFNFKLSNILDIIHHQKQAIQFSFHTFGKHLKINDVLKNDATNEEFLNYDVAFSVATLSDNLLQFDYFPAMELELKNLSGELKNYPNKIHQIKAKIHTTSNDIVVDDCYATIGKSDLHLRTKITNVVALLSDKKEKVLFDIKADADFIDVIQLMKYNNEVKVNQDIAKELGKEEIKKLVLNANGSFISNSFQETGFFSRLNILQLQFQFNDFPKVTQTSGSFKTDTTGCIYVENIQTKIGKSDFNFNLEMKNFLSKKDTNNHIIGKIRGDLWDFDDLTQNSTSKTTQNDKKTEIPSTNNHETSVNVFSFPFPNAKLDAKVKAIRMQKYSIDNLNAVIRSTKDHKVHFDTLFFNAADGSVALNGYLNGSKPKDIYFSSTLQLDNINMDKVLYKLDNFGNEMALNENFKGILSAKIKSDVRLFPDLAVDLAKTTAHIELKLKDGMIQNFSPMHSLSTFMGDKNLDKIKFGELDNVIDFKNGIVTIPKMQIASTLGYLYLKGTHTTNMDMDYEFDVPLSLIKKASVNAMRSKLGINQKKSNQKLNDMEEEIISGQSGLQKYLRVIMKGNMNNENLDIKLDGVKRN
jgi:hypothetical protein